MYLFCMVLESFKGLKHMLLFRVVSILWKPMCSVYLRKDYVCMFNLDAPPECQFEEVNQSKGQEAFSYVRVNAEGRQEVLIDLGKVLFMKEMVGVK